MPVGELFRGQVGCSRQAWACGEEVLELLPTHAQNPSGVVPSQPARLYPDPDRLGADGGDLRALGYAGRGHARLNSDGELEQGAHTAVDLGSGSAGSLDLPSQRVTLSMGLGQIEPQVGVPRCHVVFG